jgi:hypothetical protein
MARIELNSGGCGPHAVHYDSIMGLHVDDILALAKAVCSCGGKLLARQDAIPFTPLGEWGGLLSRAVGCSEPA